MDLSIGILKRTAGGSDAQPRKEKKDDAELVEIFKPNQNNLLQFLKYPTFIYLFFFNIQLLKKSLK